jgi:hypothetical protein
MEGINAFTPYHLSRSLALSLLLIFQKRQDARLQKMTHEKRVCVCVCMCGCREQLWLRSSSQLPWSSVTSTGYPTRSPPFDFHFFAFFASSFLFLALIDFLPHRIVL